MINKLKFFIKVAEYKSFSKAARTLNTTTSSVSRHIDNLEQEIGIKLLNRTTRHVGLTESGEVLLNSAKQITNDLDATLNTLKPMTSEPEGNIKISVFESFGRICICPLIPKFLKKYPKISIDIALENRIQNIYHDDIDLAIRIGEPEDSTLIMKKLLNNNVVVCAGKQYFEEYSYPQSPNDLKHHNCLTIKTSSNSNYWYFEKQRKRQRIAIKGNIISQSASPLLIAAKQGTGIIMLSDWMIKNELEKKELIQLLPQWQASFYEKGNDSVYGVFKNSKYMKPALRAFVDFIADELKEV